MISGFLVCQVGFLVCNGGQDAMVLVYEFGDLIGFETGFGFFDQQFGVGDGDRFGNEDDYRIFGNVGDFAVKGYIGQTGFFSGFIEPFFGDGQDVVESF
jgi:hypothetical protein